MFDPLFCPYRHCSNHNDPERGFYIRRGTYKPKCRPCPVQRYQCRACRRFFSRQTFRTDFRDHKPHLNGPVFELLMSGVGLRQTARVLSLSRRCTELKFRKLGRHLRQLNLNLRWQITGNARLHFDEFETYEGQRGVRPLTIAVLLDSETRYIIWAESAPIRPHGKLTPRRRRLIDKSEKWHGKRPNGSKHAVRRTLRRGADLVKQALQVRFESDEKSTYPKLARQAFGRARLDHVQTNSKLARGNWNPLFPVNHEEAIMRDLMGRLRRESWLVSKSRRYLDIALQMHIAYRNFVRRRFNRDKESPAQLLGFTSRRLTVQELLSWKQVWGKRSPHPLTRFGTSVEDWESTAALAS